MEIKQIVPAVGWVALYQTGDKDMYRALLKQRGETKVVGLVEPVHDDYEHVERNRRRP
jgi:hypothetical protein